MLQVSTTHANYKHSFKNLISRNEKTYFERYNEKIWL